MACSRIEWVDGFAGGTLARDQVAALEAHVEECRECFLRMVAAADELPEQSRISLLGASSAGSSIRSYLSTLSGTETVLAGHVSTAPERQGETFGPYAVTGVLGIGGMGIVYRARHEVTGQEVALKTVKLPVVASFMAMLRQEIEFLREAHHPAIVSIVDSDLTAEEPWYAMELLDGPTLQEFNRRLWYAAPRLKGAEQPPAAGGQLPRVLRLYARLCDPLAFIHGAGMIHGDIKPSNVSLRGAEDPVLMDFGLASRTRGTIGRETLDVTGRIRGTLPYLAPELIRGQIPDARADLYALGCILYESAVGAPPFASSSGVKIIDMHLTTPPRPASELVAGIPPQLDRLLAQLLAKNPGERLGHASALGAMLSVIADSLSPSPSSGDKAVVSSPTTLPLFRPPLVGRDDDVASVLEGVQLARRSSSGRLYLVSGESGIGKTFFAAEIAQRTLLNGLSVVTSECLPMASTSEAGPDAGTTPLQGFRRLFERLRDRCLEHGPTETQRLFGDRLAVLTTYLPFLAHLRAPGEAQETPPPLPAAAGRERIIAAVVDTLAAYVSDRPALLALDDLQWADDLTLAVLERASEQLLPARPLIVLGTYRTDEANEPIRRLAVHPRTRVMPLRRLVKKEIAGMVGGMLSLPDPPEALIEFVDGHAEGVPFYAAEYLRSLVASGALACRDGTWSLRAGALAAASPTPAHPLPRKLQELIGERLRRLPRESAELLEAGAVLGRRFSVSLLARIVNRPAAEVASLLNGTVAAQITDTDGLDEYTFLHDKIRETLYANLSSERRARLHLSTAHALADGATAIPDHYGQIAHHFRDGGDPARAVDYLEKAASHALELAANGDADRFLREALDLESQLPSRVSPLRRARWLRQQGDALSGLGMMAESAQALKAAAALLGRPFPDSKLWFAFALGWQILTQIWYRLRPARAAGPSSAADEALAEVGRVFDRMHEVAFYLGRDADLVLSTMVCLNSAEQAGAAETRSIAYSNAAMMAGVLPARQLAERYFQLARSALGANSEMVAEAWLLEMDGHYRVWQGQFSKAHACLEQVAAMAGQSGFSRRQDEAECVLIGADLWLGKHEAALQRTREVERRARKRRDTQVQCWLVLQRAECHIVRGDLAAALAEVTGTDPLLATVGRPERLWAMGLEAYLRLQQNEPAAALELLRSGMALAVLGPPVHSYCLTAYERMAETALDLYVSAPPGRQPREILSLARRACALTAKAARIFPIIRPLAQLHRGTLELLCRPRRASAVIDTWTGAAREASRMAVPYTELRLHLAITKHAEPCSSLREETLRRVRELARELDVKADLPVTREAAARSGGAVQIEGEAEQPNGP